MPPLLKSLFAKKFELGVVYFDAVQLEKALVNGQVYPTAFTPHPVSIAHPASHTSPELSGEESYWQW